MRLSKIPFLTLAVALALSVSVFAAAPLAPGVTLLNPDIGAGSFFTTGSLTTLYPSMALIASQTNAMVALTGFEGLSGNVTSNVYEDTSYPVGSRPLAFEYIFDPDSSATTELDRATMTGYNGITITDCGAANDGNSVAVGAPTWTDGDPYSIERDSGDPTDLTLQWHFQQDGTTLPPDSGGNDYVSASVWFVTTSLVYNTTKTSLQDSGAVAGAKILAPVPEPATLALFGLAAVAGLAIRRKMA